MVFDLGQLITQARSFGAILCRFDTVLDGRDAAHCIHNFRKRILLVLAKMFELIGVSLAGLSSLPELRIGPVQHGAVKLATHGQVSVVGFLHPAIV